MPRPSSPQPPENGLRAAHVAGQESVVNPAMLIAHETAMSRE